MLKYQGPVWVMGILFIIGIPIPILINTLFFHNEWHELGNNSFGANTKRSRQSQNQKYEINPRWNIRKLGCLREQTLWPSEAISCHTTWSTLVQVIACCLTAPTSKPLPEPMIISGVLWHSPGGNFTRNANNITVLDKSLNYYISIRDYDRSVGSRLETFGQDQQLFTHFFTNQCLNFSKFWSGLTTFSA